MRVDELVVRGRDGGEDSEPAERMLPRELGEDAGGDARPADAVEPVAPGDDIAFELVVAALVPVADDGAVGVKRVDGHVVHVEVEWSAAREPKGDEILHEL